MARASAAHRRRWVLSVVFVTVISIDQIVKGWAWRTLDTTHINSGGDQLVSRTVSSWFADPVRGAVLDAANVVVLTLVAVIVWRRRASRWFAIPATIAIAGWSSNLLDRLGMHYVTAPGAVRGAVDYIPIGKHYYNVADLFILSATPLAVIAAIALGLRGVVRRGRAGAAARPTVAASAGGTIVARQAVLVRPVVIRSAVAVAFLGAVIVAVTFGSVDYGGVSANVWLLAERSGQVPGIQ